MIIFLIEMEIFFFLENIAWADVLKLLVFTINLLGWKMSTTQ